MIEDYKLASSQKAFWYNFHFSITFILWKKLNSDFLNLNYLLSKNIVFVFCI